MINHLMYLDVGYSTPIFFHFQAKPFRDAATTWKDIVSMDLYDPKV